jgi:hypothetical protein
VFFPRAIRVIGGSSIQPTPVPGALRSCTGYRWPIKIAADPGAPQIVSSPTPTTIGNLISLHKPPAAAIRNAPAETTTWQIANARLTLLYQEHDRDYHLVLQDNAGHHLIAEAPDPACARTSVLSLQLAHVRSEINARFGSVHGAMRPYVQVSASGVGFFDEYSGSAGQARNGIELHPLTAICFGANCALP